MVPWILAGGIVMVVVVGATIVVFRVLVMLADSELIEESGLVDEDDAELSWSDEFHAV